MDFEYGETLYHNKAQWLSRGKVLKRLFELGNEIILFIKMKNKEVPLLADSGFQCNFVFVTDIRHHLNILNFQLQCKKQFITQMCDHVKSFTLKLGLWIK